MDRSKQCQVCLQNFPIENLIEKADYCICHLCEEKVAKRLKKQQKNASKQKSFTIDREELIGLKTEGLLPLRTYVYLALRLDGYQKSLKSINNQKFCERWGIVETDFIIAIAALKKKGVIDVKIPDLTARAYSHQEKKEMLEKQFKNRKNSG